MDQSAEAVEQRRKVAIEYVLQHSGPHEMMPVTHAEWIEGEDGRQRAIGQMQTISDRDYFRQQAVASQTWHHLSEQEKALIAKNWLSPEVQHLYEKMDDGRPVRG